MKLPAFIFIISLASCSTKGKAICDCLIDSSHVAIYTLGKISLAKATGECDTIRKRYPGADTCWAYIDN